MAKLSIIVPVFNTKVEFFVTCLESLKNLSVKGLEVIVVDDGSTENYDNLKKKYPNFKFFKTENKGTLSARLFGIEKATGDYVAFVDSDDKVSFDYYEAMLFMAEETGAEIVINNWAFWTERAKYVCQNDSTIKTNFISEDDGVLRRYFRFFGTEHSYYVLWNKIFKRELLLWVKNRIDQENLDKMVFAEDVLITFFAFSKASKIANTHLGNYYYRIHVGQEIFVSSEDKFFNQHLTMSKVFSLMEKHLKEIGRFDELSKHFYMWKNIMASSAYETAKHSKFKNKAREIKDIYGVKKVKRLPWVAHKPYAKHKLLPQNVEEVESAIQKVFFSNKHLVVFAKKRSFAFQELVMIKFLFGKKFDLASTKKVANFVMPKEKQSFKLKIIHNRFFYSLGILLFPKGSNIRKKLKSKL